MTDKSPAQSGAPRRSRPMIPADSSRSHALTGMERRGRYIALSEVGSFWRDYESAERAWILELYVSVPPMSATTSGHTAQASAACRANQRQVRRIEQVGRCVGVGSLLSSTRVSAIPQPLPLHCGHPASAQGSEKRKRLSGRPFARARVTKSASTRVGAWTYARRADSVITPRSSAPSTHGALGQSLTSACFGSPATRPAPSRERSEEPIPASPVTPAASTNTSSPPRPFVGRRQSLPVGGLSRRPLAAPCR